MEFYITLNYMNGCECDVNVNVIYSLDVTYIQQQLSPPLLHSTPSNTNPGDQYSHSPHWLSTHNILSATKSSIAVFALALDHLRFSTSVDSVTYPIIWAAERTSLWSVLSSLGTERMYCFDPILGVE